jgi:uncharacterized protein (DUF305 family)
MRSGARLRAAGLVALTVAVVVSGCGGTSGSDARTDRTVSTSTTQPGPHNADDVAFAQNMIPHHQQAVELAAMVPSHSTNHELIVVAKHIGIDQRAEIGILTDLLSEWHEPVSMPMHGGMNMDGGMHVDGMVDSATMKRLPSLTGPEFDQLWMTSMISHHEGAIAMAQNEIARGQNPHAISVATNIIPAQQFEIARMNRMLNTSS